MGRAMSIPCPYCKAVLSPKGLKPGKYQATVVATDAAGQQSAPVTVRFRIAGR